MNKGDDFVHQDWNTYIVHCKTTPTNVKKENNSIKKSSNNFANESKMDTKIEEGNLRHKKVSEDLVGDFKKWRSSQNLTQKDVAVKLSVQSQIINKFETGQLNHNPQLIGKIKRLMNNGKKKK
jgi:ribosome-binding protein aMBF1 (putative translation factor)